MKYKKIIIIIIKQLYRNLIIIKITQYNYKQSYINNKYIFQIQNGKFKHSKINIYKLNKKNLLFKVKKTKFKII